MDGQTGRIGVVGVSLAIFLTGCQSFFGPQKPPADPLFEFRKPAEVKAETGPPLAIAFSEPTPPNQPFFDPNRPGLAVKKNATPGMLTNRPNPLVIPPPTKEP